MMRLSILFTILLLAVPAAAANAPAAGVVSLGGAIKASPEDTMNAPDVVDLKNIPLVRTMLQGGAELYYIGQHAGLHGFAIYHKGKFQFLYLTPDQQSVIIGGMFSGEGANITSEQVKLAAAQNTQLKAILMAATEQQQAIERAGAAGGGTPSAKPDADKGPPTVNLSPGERLYQDFQSAAGVALGQDGKPAIMMLVAPHCPYCKATWKELRDHVERGALRVKLVPIGTEGSEDERLAANILSAANPLGVWNRLADGDASALDGAASASNLAAIRANIAMVTGWKINATPYIVYRGKDGKVKVVQGRPEKIAAILTDAVP